MERVNILSKMENTKDELEIYKLEVQLLDAKSLIKLKDPDHEKEVWTKGCKLGDQRACSYL